jgi:hypothetical protein
MLTVFDNWIGDEDVGQRKIFIETRVKANSKECFVRTSSGQASVYSFRRSKASRSKFLPHSQVPQSQVLFDLLQKVFSTSPSP